MQRVVQPAVGDPAIPQRYSLTQAIGLHLAPGLLIGAIFGLSAPLAYRWHLPPFLALCFAGAIIFPALLGFLLYQGYQINGHSSLDGVVDYRDPLPWWQLALLISLTFVASGGLIVLLSPIGNWLFTAFFSWLPEWLLITPDLQVYSKTTLAFSYLIFFLIIVLLAPIVEEIYFRGYLLPRLAYLGRWGVVLHSALFALYHIWTPWLCVGRAIGLLPLIVAVRWKRNIYIGIGAHILANSIDLMVGVVFILQMN